MWCHQSKESKIVQTNELIVHYYNCAVDTVGNRNMCISVMKMKCPRKKCNYLVNVWIPVSNIYLSRNPCELMTLSISRCSMNPGPTGFTIADQRQCLEDRLRTSREKTKAVTSETSDTGRDSKLFPSGHPDVKTRISL